MKLTKRKAIELSIELWEWCAETGNGKHKWPGWKIYSRADTWSDCFLCEYDVQYGGWCDSCPIANKYGSCYETPFAGFISSHKREDRKKYAAQCVEILKDLLPKARKSK